MRPRRVRRHGDGERGAVLVLTGVFMVGLLVVAAIVVDLGQMRSTRRHSQSATDLAALAAGYYLSGRGTSGDAKAEPRAACQAALASIKANVADFPDSASMNCDAFPVQGITPDCTNLTPSKTLVATGSGNYTLAVTYPVTAGQIKDTRFVGDGKDDGLFICQRMKVSLQAITPTLFAKIMGVNTLQTAASSVMRADTSTLGEGVAALLLLERLNCGSLQISGGGSGGAGVIVRASGPFNPGVIQADSAGTVGPCTTNANASGYVVWGTPLPSASGGGPSIRAEDSSAGIPGIIGLYSLNVGGRGGAVEGTGIWPKATGSGIQSRIKADEKYNRSTSTGGHEQIRSIHERAYQRTDWTAATATAQGYRVISGADCRGLDTTVTPVSDVKVFVECGSFEPDRVIFPNATDVIFTGKVDIANNKLLSLPSAQRVYVRGCYGCTGTGGNNFSVSVAGELRVNTGGDGTVSTNCADRKGSGAGGSTTNWTEIATLGGPLKVTNQVRLCQTFVYLGESTTTYTRRTVTATGALSPNSYPAIADCSVKHPCPMNDTGTHSIQITSGSGAVDWSAPNQVSSAANQSDLATYPFEDLALWTEASYLSSIKGQGYSRTEGVFFMPNSPMEFTGQASQQQPLNAQFLARSLNVSGQGTLDLRPNPDDSIVTPLAGDYMLIR